MTCTDIAWFDPTNADQLKAWDTEEGVFWADHAALFEHSLHRYDDWLLRAAGIRDGDRVLDVGCGTGSTTRTAAWLAGSGAALGVHLSSPMLSVATRLAHDTGARNTTFLQADAQVHAFEPFDVILSRSGCMFFGDPIAAFTNLERSLKPGGRVAFLAWQPPSQNPWFTELAAALDLSSPPLDVPGPFALADPARVAHILTTAGFPMPECESLREPMYFGPDVPSAEDFVMGSLFPDLDAGDRMTLRAALQDHLTPEGVTFTSAAWLVTTHKAP
jgi:SAM-dependent methyltransferase